MRAQSRFALVEAKGDGERRAIADGFAFAAGVERAPGLDLGAPRLEGAAFAYTPRTGFMLEPLRTCFGLSRIGLFNLTTAGSLRPARRPPRSSMRTARSRFAEVCALPRHAATYLAAALRASSSPPGKTS